MHRVRAALCELPDVTLVDMSDANELAPALAHAQLTPNDLLVIHGGDGTVQRLLTQLLSLQTQMAWPVIALLPGGTTNMTIYDINEQRRLQDCLDRLKAYLKEPSTVATVDRSLVQVNTNAATHVGLFFGLGDIVRGIEYFHSRIQHHSVRNETGAGLALLRTAWCIMRNQPPFDQPLEVAFHNRSQQDCVKTRLLFVTALERLFLNIRPYWGDPACGTLKSTLVQHDAKHFFRNLPALLRGQPNQNMQSQPAYQSEYLNDLTLSYEGAFTIDGEIFTTTATEPVHVSALNDIRFCPL